MRRRLVGALVAGLVLVVPTLAAVVPAAPAGAASPITGGGSSFAALEIDQWRADTARNPFGLKVNYVAQGSTFGRQEFINGNLDFGASDIVFLSNELPTLQAKRCGGRAPNNGCFVYVPVSAGGLAFMYNLLDGAGHRVTNLQLTRQAACKIFTGVITKWNDPELVATNPQLAGFSRDIVPVIRADGAGESYVFSQFCQAVAPQVWSAFINERIAHDPQNIAADFRAGQPVSNWPQNWGRSAPQLYSDGTANTVADAVAGKDSITYVAAGYAKVRSFPTASLQNAAGVFTQPDETNVTVALGYAKGRGDGTFELNFTGPDPRAYFPSTYSYILAQTTGFDRGKGAALGQFLCYAISQGQVIAPQLRYARLSAPLVQIGIDAIANIPGAPAKADCYVKGAPPPLGAVVPEGVAGGKPVSAAEKAAAERLAQQEAAAAAAAAEAAKAAKAAHARQVNLDEALKNAAAEHQAHKHRTETLWLIVSGAVLAAGISAAFAVRRRRVAT